MNQATESKRQIALTERILALIKEHKLDLGMRPPLRLTLNPGGATMSFKQPPELTYYGEKLMAFAQALVAAERERCANLCDDRARQHEITAPSGLLYLCATQQAEAEDCAEAIRKEPTP